MCEYGNELTAYQLCKQGHYKKAEKEYNNFLVWENRETPKRLESALYNRLICLEQLGRKNEIHQMMAEALEGYIQKLDVLCQGVNFVNELYSSRFLRKPEIDPDVNDLIPGILETVKSLNGDGEDEDSESPAKRRRLTGNCKDPFTLPSEIVHQILGQVGGLGSLSRVSRRWHNAVVWNSDLYRSPTFRENAGLAEVTTYLEACGNYGLRRVSHLTLPCIQSSQEGVILKTICESGLQIDSLEISGEGFDFSVLKDCSINAGNAFRDTRSFKLHIKPKGKVRMHNLVRHLPKLREVCITIDITIECDDDEDSYPDFSMTGSRFGQLDSLELITTGKGTYYRDLAAGFLQKCDFSGVRSLHLSSGVFWTDGLVYALRKMRPGEIRLNHIGLDYLGSIMRVIGSEGILPTSLELSGLKEETIQGNCSGLSNITQLQLGPLKDVPSKAICGILDQTNKNLETLELKGRDFTYEISDKEDLLSSDGGLDFMDILQKCPRLEVLGVTGFPCFDDKRCKELGSALKATESRLKCLTLSCRSLSDAGILSLFDKGFSMPSLELHLLGDEFTNETIRSLRAHCAKVYYGSQNMCDDECSQFVQGRFVE